MHERKHGGSKMNEFSSRLGDLTQNPLIESALKSETRLLHFVSR